MIRTALLAFGVLFAAAPALAFNHESVVAPITIGPHRVACSNIAQDTSKMAPGTVPADYWEGHLVNDQPAYITQILAAPQTAIVYDGIAPDDRGIYPNTANVRTPFVAIVCHPTPATNNDPDYALPGGVGVVPHMQPAGAAPKLLGERVPLVVYSHGLGGSPVGKGYIESIAALASHGYMVAAVFHADNRFSRVRVENLSDFFYLLTQYDRVAEMMLMRPVALKAMTDVLLAHPGFAPGIDTDRIAGFGASLGGQAIANLMGAKLTTSMNGACRETVRDARIKVAVGFVPYAGQNFLPSFCEGQAGAAEVTRPYLALSGTADTTAPLKLAKQALNRFQGSRYMVELTDGEHELRAEDIGDLFTWMITFYRSYLQDDSAAFARFVKMRGVSGGREDNLTIDAHVPTNVGGSELRVVELHNDLIDRYFLEPNESELVSILQGSAGPGWSTTGHSFRAWAQAPVSSIDACHYELGAEFTGTRLRDCGYAKRLGRWMFDNDGGFFIEAADANGNCPDGRLKVNRVYNPRLALARNFTSQRFVTSDSAARELIANGWVPLPATMCARP